MTSRNASAHIPTIGLIVPPASGQVPQDAALLYGDRVRFVAVGLGISAISPAGFAPVASGILDRAKELRDQGAQAISLMGTSLSFYRGAAFAEDMRLAMEDATQVPCTTMSHAIVSALRELDVQRVAVATSYIDELNRGLVEFLGHSGFEVTAIEGMSLSGVQEVGEVTPAQLFDLARRVHGSGAQAQGVLISCGGLLTLDVLQPLEADLGVPVVASSPSGFWDVMRLLALDTTAAGYGRLFEPRVN